MAEQQESSKQSGNGVWPLWLLPGVVLAVAWLWAGANIRPSLVRPFFRPILTTDINQSRLNTAVPIPQGNFTISQTFVPRWNGLREIELILVRHSEAAAGENGRLTLQLYDDNSTLIAADTLHTRRIEHNQTHLFRFPAQPSSAGRGYSLQISGSADNTVTIWGYDLDVYGAGAMEVRAGPSGEDGVETAVQDLRFISRSQLTWRDVLISLRDRVISDGLPLLLALAFIPLPGLLLLLFGPRQWQTWDRVAWWGVALALGIAFWPLLWFGVTLAGGRLWGWLLWLLFSAGWITVILLSYRHRQAEERACSLGRLGTGSERSRSRSEKKIAWYHLVLITLLLVSLAVRFLAVRDLTFPAWVDASRHGLITAVMAENGRTPTGYAPYLPVERFPYHFGFHTISASLALMTGWPLPQLLLILGQMLNGLMPLMLYTAVWLLTGRPHMGLIAAFLVGLPFFFPAYYATWGRFTQLTAMLIMPVLLAFTWRLLQGGKEWRQSWWVVALLVTGLFYLHFRVFLLYLPFVPLAWMANRGRQTGRLLLAALLAALLTGPRLIQLLQITQPENSFNSSLANYNDFPFSYVQTGWERLFLWLAAASFLVSLAAWRKRKRWVILPLTLVGWTAVLIILLAGKRLGLPETTLINLNSMYITLFVPLAIFLAVVTGHTWHWLLPPRPAWQIPAYLLLGGVLALTAVFGIQQQITILNEQTILAQTADLAGLQWAEEHLPAEAKMAVNSWRWLGNTWAGADGGAWLVPLTGRESTTPPVDYIYNRSLFEEVRLFNEAAEAVEDWSDPEQAEWLRQQDVTHIFIGAKGSIFDPAALAQNPEMEMVYGRDGAFIFALSDNP
jgi:4-amino-4-deoxy-L-arabinose transferase-like glycosyltransferase